MGYYVNTVDSDFYIPKDKLDDAYKAVCDLNNHNELKNGGRYPMDKTIEGPHNGVWFSWMDWNYPETCPNLQSVMEQVGFHTYESDDGDLVIHLYNNKHGCQDVFLWALAPFASSNGEFPVMDWEGESGERWRNIVFEGRLYEQPLTFVAADDPQVFEPHNYSEGFSSLIAKS